MELKKILITGGSRGIGRALIDQFQREAVEIHSVSRSISKDLDSRHRQYQFDLSSNEKAQEFRSHARPRRRWTDDIAQHIHSTYNNNDDNIVNDIGHICWMTVVQNAQTWQALEESYVRQSLP